MSWSLNSDGHLDLSGCYLSRGYDWFSVEGVAREYYFSEMAGLVAWKGSPEGTVHASDVDKAKSYLAEDRAGRHVLTSMAGSALPADFLL